MEPASAADLGLAGPLMRFVRSHYFTHFLSPGNYIVKSAREPTGLWTSQFAMLETYLHE